MSARTVAVALLVLLAGCNGAGIAADDSASPRTLTPAVVPETTPEPVARVPGLGATRLVDEEALVAAHRAGLAGTSYRLIRQRRVVGPNGTLDAVRVTAVVDGEAYRVSRVERSTPGWYTAATYARLDVWYRDGTVRNRFLDESRQPRYWGSDVAAAGGPVTDPTRARFVADALAAVRYRVRNVSRTGDATLYRLAATGPSERAVGSAPSLLVDVRNRSLTATVRDDGVVVGYRLRYEATFKNRSVRVTERYAVTGMGETTVGRPAWLSAANATVAG